MHVLTSKRAPNSAYGQVVARSVDYQIGISAASVGDTPYLDRHTEGLRSLRDILNSLSGDDARVFALWTCQNRGGGDSDDFAPGEEQQVFLSSVGLTGDLDSQLPDSGELLSEFVALGCLDGFDRQQAAMNRLPDEAGRALEAEVARYRGKGRGQRDDERDALRRTRIRSRTSWGSGSPGRKPPPPYPRRR